MFQNPSIELSNKLLETLQSNLPQLLICLPKIFEKKDLQRMTKDAFKFWNRYIIFNRKAIYRLLNFNITYGNSQFTRNYIDNKNKNFSKIYFNKTKRIWENRNIVIIEGRYTRFGINNDLLNNVSSIKRILCPEKNAFSKYTKILNEALKQDKNILFLIALGPTATILAYDLCKNGYQAIDIGHLDIEYEWFLINAVEKKPIQNKYINENNFILNESNDTLNDLEYKEQILSIIL